VSSYLLGQVLWLGLTIGVEGFLLSAIVVLMVTHVYSRLDMPHRIARLVELLGKIKKGKMPHPLEPAEHPNTVSLAEELVRINDRTPTIVELEDDIRETTGNLGRAYQLTQTNYGTAHYSSFFNGFTNRGRTWQEALKDFEPLETSEHPDENKMILDWITENCCKISSIPGETIKERLDFLLYYWIGGGRKRE
jgi:hypothetical protein